MGDAVGSVPHPILNYVSPVAETSSTNLLGDLVARQNATIDESAVLENSQYEVPSQSVIQAVSKSADDTIVKKGIAGVK